MTDSEIAELQEYRRQDLLRSMQEISRDHWAAGWNSGLEHDLFLMTFHGAPADYGMGLIAPALLARIKRLAELTQIWWRRADESSELIAIPLAEAEQRFSKLIAEDDDGVIHTLSIPEAKLAFQAAAADDWDHETIKPVLSGMPVWQVYRLRALPVITLFQRKAKGDWELRFGDTTVDFVVPAWARRS
jgi:hypothetical protein